MRIHRVALIAVVACLALNAFAFAIERPAKTDPQPQYKTTVWIQALRPQPPGLTDSRQMTIIYGTRRYVANDRVIQANEANLRAIAAAQEAAARASERPTPTQAATVTVSSGSAYPGALTYGMFPCIEMAESTDNPSAHSGLYGDLDRTWNGYDGYPDAGSAPLYVQNQFNQDLYNRLGWRPWNDYCTGT